MGINGIIEERKNHGVLVQLAASQSILRIVRLEVFIAMDPNWHICPKCQEPITTQQLISFNDHTVGYTFLTCPMCEQTSPSIEWTVPRDD